MASGEIALQALRDGRRDVDRRSSDWVIGGQRHQQHARHQTAPASLPSPPITIAITRNSDRVSGKAPGRDALREHGEQGAAEAGAGRADHERQDLGTGDADPGQPGGGLVVADGSRSRPNRPRIQVRQQQHGQQRAGPGTATPATARTGMRAQGRRVERRTDSPWSLLNVLSNVLVIDGTTTATASVSPAR